MPGLRRSPVLLVLASLAAAVPARADSWFYDPVVTKKESEFGKTKVVLEVDARENQSYPAHTVHVYREGTLVASLKDVGYDQVYASGDGRYFVGLSNHGIPGTAFVIFDRDGKLVRHAKHAELPPGVHTEMSVTVLRRWYDADKPAVRFQAADDGKLAALSVRGSTGQTYDLLKPDLGFKREAEKE